MLGLVLLLIASYAYFANSAVRSITLLGEIDTRKDNLSSTIVGLESKSMALDQEMNMQKAYLLGLSSANNPTFLFKDTSSKISLNVN